MRLRGAATAEPTAEKREAHVSNPIVPQVFPAMLRALRLHHGLSQRQLAARAVIPQSRIAENERPTHVVREDVLAKLSTALGYADLLAMLAHGIELLRNPTPEPPVVPPKTPDKALMQELLARTGWRWQDLAAHLALSPGHVAKVLGGERKLGPDARARLEALHAATPTPPAPDK
jgi:hypothetical protein